MLGGCQAGPQPVALTGGNKWLHPPNQDDSGWVRLAQENIFEVQNGALTAAVGELESVPVKRITQIQAEQLVGKTYRAKPGNDAYLVRAVRVLSKTGLFIVQVKADALHVGHVSLGSGQTPLFKSALVVNLAKKPRRVFIEVSVAE